MTRKLFPPGTISDLTYPARLEKFGLRRYADYHTFYVWIASDVSFPGAIIVVFLIGRLLGLVWIDVLRLENPFAVALFPLLILMIFYFPANNQVLGFGPTATAFWAMLVLWMWTGKRARRTGHLPYSRVAIPHA